MNLNPTAFPKFNTWIIEDKTTKQTFEKINEKLESYGPKLMKWNREALDELASDLLALDEHLPGRIDKLQEENKEDLEPLMKRTRELLQGISDNAEVRAYNYDLKKYQSGLHSQGVNLRRKICTLQLHLFSSHATCVRYYAEKLKGYPEKLKNWSESYYEYEDLAHDISAYDPVLLNRIKQLSHAEREKLKPLLSAAYAALEKLKTGKHPYDTYAYSDNIKYYGGKLGSYNKSLHDEKFNFIGTLTNVQGFLESQTGASIDLYRLGRFASLFDNSPGNIYVLNSDGIDILLFDTVKEADQERVYKYLEEIYLALGVESTLKHVSTQDLVKMKAVCGFLMGSYEKYMLRGVPLTAACFAKLAEINKRLNGCLKGRGEEVAEAVKEGGIHPLFFRMQAFLRNNTYFKAFWKDPRHVEQLKSHHSKVDTFVKSLADPEAVTVDGLVFLKELTDGSEKSKFRLRIYVPERSEDRVEDSQEVVIFCTGTENHWAYWNVLQDREFKEFNLPGLGHKPVMDNACPANEALTKYLGESEHFDLSKVKTIKFAAFGLDGAVAQLLGYNLAKKLPGAQISTYSLGTPAYLDSNAAVQIAQQKNLYSINFALAGDNNLKANYKLLQGFHNKWSDWSFYTYPLYNSNWFFGDWSGHSSGNYWANAESAIKFPLELYTVYQEAEELLNPTTHV